MASIDSDIYVIHNAFSKLRAKKKIPQSVTYEQWCKELRDSNGSIYVMNDNEGETHYMVKYDGITNYLSVPNDAKNYEIDQFKGLSGKIPYTDYQDFIASKSNNAGAVHFKRNVGYSIRYDYLTDDELDDTDFQPTEDTKCIKLPPI